MLAAISAPPASRHRARKDAPADPVDLADLLRLADDAGLADLQLGLPPYRPDGWMSCEARTGDCKYLKLCRRRVAVGLWAVCEEPWQNDLIVLAELPGISVTSTKRDAAEERAVA